MPLSNLYSRELELVLFGGKGGVGKTSCAAATAIELSRTYKTLLISSDPAHSVSDTLEQDIGFKLQTVKNFGNLSAIEIVGDKAFAEFKKQHEPQLKKLFDTSTNLDEEDINHLMQLSIPGIDEVMSFKYIIDFFEEGKFEKYVVDSAPTGHTLRLISSPKLLDEWIKVISSMRWKYRYMIKSFSGSYEQDDADELLVNLKKTVKRIEKLLRNREKCEFIPVCVPEWMVIKETDKLLKRLNNINIHPRQLVVNNVMEAEDGEFCRRKKNNQSIYLDEINQKFKNFNIVKIPLFPEEVKGIDTLEYLGGRLLKKNEK
ncbi:MAG: ArsA family ATPase [Bacteroidales bacterium]|nr:ArsA family ATPase [Bacteroidales bacterium]MCF8338279.1 ArsA family ATPase [Bacteroidales bacterium]